MSRFIGFSTEKLPVDIEVYSLYIFFSYKNLDIFFEFFSILFYHVYKCLEHVQKTGTAVKHQVFERGVCNYKQSIDRHIDMRELSY